MDGPYPVKKKGERRRLDPDWVAIAWLEAATLDDTRIIDNYPFGDEGRPEFRALVAKGKWQATMAGMYPRRMFDVFHLEASSTVPVRYENPCPDCDNFAYARRCGSHPELPYDLENRRWVKPAPEPGREGFQIPDRLNQAARELNPWLPGAMSFSGLLPRGTLQISFQVNNANGLFRSLEGEWVIEDAG